MARPGRSRAGPAAVQPAAERRATATRSDVLSPAAQTPGAFTGALLVRGSTLRVLNLIAGVAVGVFLMPFLIHALGDRWYGLWILVGSITSYYALLDIGLTSAVTRFLTQAIAREEETHANAVIATGLVLFASFGALVFLVAIGVALGAGSFFENPSELAAVRQAVLILGADVALGFPFAIFNAVLVAHYRFDLISYVQLLGLALRTGLVVYFVGQDYSIVVIAVITLAVSLISRFAVLAAAWRVLPSLQLHPSLFDRRRAGELFGYGKYTFFAASADRVRFQVDTLVVASFLGVGAVTHYAIAERIAQLFMHSVLEALGVIGPLFTRFDALGDHGKSRETLLLTTRLSTLASVMLAGCILILGQRFIEVWIGRDYRDAYWPLVILTSSFAVALMQLPSVSFVYASGRHRLFAYGNSAEAVANLALSVALVQVYGMIGVSLGTALPLLISNIVLAAYVCRELSLKLHVYIVNLCRVALIAGISQVPLFAYVQIQGISSLAAMVGIALCYYPLCGVILFRVIVAEADRRRIGDAALALSWFQPR
jgi:O-antigen/teichoic acid export membrane protein